MSLVELQYGTQTIEVHLEYCKRKTLGIYVEPTQTVKVKAPIGSPKHKILNKVLKRASWILERQAYFREYDGHIETKKYVTGETHRYLGKQYRLRVISSDEETVKLKDGYFHVFTNSNTNRDQIKKLMDQWLTQKAQGIFKEMIEGNLDRFKRYKLTTAEMGIRRMKTRWGSCSSRGKITLNLELIRASKGCIEYVIVHELCHLIERNHNKRFYDLLTRVMPDWKRWREKLNKTGDMEL